MIGNDAEIKKVSRPDHPDRCQSTLAQGRSGQCMNVAEPGSDFCKVHGGTNKSSEQGLYNLRLTQARWQRDISQQANSTGIKSLRDEIGVLRVILQEKLNAIGTPNDLITQCGPLGALIMQIEKLVTSCHKTESSMGMLVDKSVLLQFAGEVVSIIAAELEAVPDNSQIIDKIACRITESISRSDEDES
jgi:hypothetical protein